MPPTVINLTGSWPGSTGSVDIVRPMELTLAGNTWPPTAVQPVLDAAGSISLMVYATDNPGVIPTGAYYNITERINGTVRSYSIIVPYDSPNALIDLNTVIPAVLGELAYLNSGTTVADGSITTAKIADNAVTTPKIANANVTTIKVADANITTDKIADANVTTTKVADGAITPAKLDRTYATGSPTVLATNKLLFDARISHPLPTAILKGTFVAPASGMVDITTDLHGSNLGYAHANLGLVVGIPVNGKLRTGAQFAPLVAGAQRRIIGRAQAENFADIYRTDRFVGLTAGTTYHWHLESVIVGGSATMAIGNASDLVIHPNELTAYVANDTGATPAFITKLTLGGRPNWSGNHQAPTAFTVGTSYQIPSSKPGPHRLAITPNGVKVVGPILLSTGVVIFNTDTNSIVTLGNPGAAVSPYSVVCPTDTEAWVGFAGGTGHICRLNLATNVWDAPIATTEAVIGMALDDTSNILYYGGVNGKLHRRILSSGSTTSADIGGRIEDIGWGGTRLWVALPGELRAVSTTSPFGTLDSIVTSGNAIRIAVTEDTMVLYAVFPNGIFRYYPTASHPNLVQNVMYDGPTAGAAGRAIRLTSDEHIFVSVDNQVAVFPGATFSVLPDSGDGPGGWAPEFLDEGLTVTVHAV